VTAALDAPPAVLVSPPTPALLAYPTTTLLTGINLAVFVGMVLTGAGLLNFNGQSLIAWGANLGPLTIGGRVLAAGHRGIHPWRA